MIDYTVSLLASRIRSAIESYNVTIEELSLFAFHHGGDVHFRLIFKIDGHSFVVQWNHGDNSLDVMDWEAARGIHIQLQDFLKNQP